MKNPLCLLTHGRTFNDEEDGCAAYKLLARNPAPRIKAGKRGAAAVSCQADESAQTNLFDERPAPKSVVEAPVPAPVEVKPPMDASRSPFVPKAPGRADPGASSAWKKSLDASKDLVRRLFLWPKERPVHQATVQSELALEKVTVLRNNLGEDDLEVVLVERKVGTGEKPLARLSKMEMTGEAWQRLTAPFRKKGGENAFSPKAEQTTPELSARSQ